MHIPKDVFVSHICALVNTDGLVHGKHWLHGTLSFVHGISFVNKFEGEGVVVLE